MIDLLTLVYAE